VYRRYFQSSIGTGSYSNAQDYEHFRENLIADF